MASLSEYLEKHKPKQSSNVSKESNSVFSPRCLCILAVLFFIILSIMSSFMFSNYEFSLMESYTIFNSNNNNKINNSIISTNPNNSNDNNLNLNLNQNENENERTEFLLLQCIAEATLERIQNFLNVYSVFIESIEYYAWYHKYKYHMEIVNMNDMSYYLSLFHFQECRAKSVVCRKMWKLWCIEKILLKYNPRWLIHFDIDMAIAAPMMFINLNNILNKIIKYYNYSNQNDISFICEDGMNTGLMFFHNQNYDQLLSNKYYIKYYNNPSNNIWNNGDSIQFLWELQYNFTYKFETGTVFISPFIQSWFDINKYVWFRDDNNKWMTDQISIMEVLLVVADWWYNIINNKNENKIYNYECIKTIHDGPHYNGCWWDTMRKKFDFQKNERQFGPYVLIGGDMSLQERGHYKPQHWIYHQKSHHPPTQWYPEYSLMFDHPWFNDVVASDEIRQNFKGKKWVRDKK